MATIPTAAALDLMYRSSTTGAPTAEFDRLGGYAAVKAAAEAAGYGATPEFIQSYEIANNLPESASTKLNKQFIGSEGAAKMAQLEADLNSQNAALAAQTRANLAAQSAAADQQAAAEAAQRAAAANSGGGPAPTTDDFLQMMRDSVTLRYLNEDLYTKTGKTYDTIAEAQAAQRAAAANSGGGPAPTTDEITQMMRDSNNQRLAEEQAREQQSMARQRAEEEAFYAARAARQASIAQQAVAQQAVAQQAAIQRAAQARSLGLLDAAPAPRAAAPAINRPTGISQPSYTQVAPAQITNRAITGTPYSSIYSPATMQQNMPTLANIQAAARSANPYAALMALTPQRALSPAYATQAGVAGANSYLGGFNPNIYNPATVPVTGLLNTTVYRVNDGAGGNVDSNAGSGGGQTGYGSLANLAGEAQRAGFTTIGNFLGGLVPVGAEFNRVDLETGNTVKGTTTQADIDALSGKNDPGSSVALSGSRQDFRAQELAAQNLAERNAFTAAMVNGLIGQSNTFAQQADALAGKTTNEQPQGYDTAGSRAAAAAAANAVANLAAAESAAPGGVNDGGFEGRTSGGNYGGDAYGGSYQFAKGGIVNMKPQMRNPPGPDDGYAALDNGEYVIRKSAVKKYGSNIFEQINAGRIPAQRLKSLLE